MLDKYFTIEGNNISVHCHLLYNDESDLKNIVLCCHGFAGSKDSSYIVLLAKRLLKAKQNTAVLSFDLPCHGDDKNAELTLEGCNSYLSAVIEYIKEQYHPGDCFYASGTSFGGYLLLKYITDHGNPFRKAVMRSPAVIMYNVLTDTILNEDDRKAVAGGRTIQAGFDVKIPVMPSFVHELSTADITKRDFKALSPQLLLIHGTDDEVVPFEAVRRFASGQSLSLISVAGADHRFTDEKLKNEAIEMTINFLDIV